MHTNPVASTIVKARRGLEQASAQLRDGLAALRDAIVAKRDELRAVASGPMTLEDSEAFIRAEVKEEGDRWLREDRGSLARRFTNPNPAHRGSVNRGVPWSANEAPPWGLRCVTEPEACVAMLLAIVERSGAAANAGLPLKDRPPVIARLRDELAALETEEEQLVDSLLEAGITVAHRAEVVQRRQNEAAEAERKREQEAREAARLKALDETHEKRANVGRSRYLASVSGDQPPAA